MRLTLYPIVFVLGILGNFLVCVLITCVKRREKRSASRYFVLSLALSDMLVLVMFVPFDLAYLEGVPQQWTFGMLMCKFVNTIAYASIVISGPTLAAISWDRYRGIVYPMKKAITSRTVITVATLIWLYAALTILPFAWSLKITNQKDCANDFNWWPSVEVFQVAFVLAGFLPGFLLPFISIVVAYILIGIHLRKSTSWNLQTKLFRSDVAALRVRQNAKTIKLLSVLIVVYILSILPHYTILMIFVFDPKSQEMPLIMEFHEFTRLMMSANSCFNPVLYGTISKEFRQRLRSLFRQRSGKVRPKRNDNRSTYC